MAIHRASGVVLYVSAFDFRAVSISVLSISLLMMMPIPPNRFAYLQIAEVTALVTCTRGWCIRCTGRTGPMRISPGIGLPAGLVAVGHSRRFGRTTATCGLSR